MRNDVLNASEHLQMNIRTQATTIVVTALIARLDELHPGFRQQIAEDAQSLAEKAMRIVEAPSEIERLLRDAIDLMLPTNLLRPS